MQILVLEYASGGGRFLQPGTAAAVPWARGDQLPLDALLPEGLAMVRAVAQDFAALEGVQVHVLREAALGQASDEAGRPWLVAGRREFETLLARLAPLADWTVLIAPEWNGILQGLSQQVASLGGRLLGPAADWVAVAGDKQATATRLAEFGLPVPLGRVLERGEACPDDAEFPAVRKPCDGCGSWGVVRYPSRQSAIARWVPPVGRERLERYCPGVPASVALLCGPTGERVMPVCRQQFTDDEKFDYCGGAVLWNAPWQCRADRWGRRVLEALGPTIGYFGIDLVLGDSENGSEDVIIEVNPRLTTSYIGLRRSCRSNLAAAMLALAAGEAVELEFDGRPWRFSGDGRSWCAK